jgi:Fic-DOC domain mobile mystery protein B
MTHELPLYSFTDVEGETPLEDDDIDGLIPTFVATRDDLNRVEYENILQAMPWSLEQVRRLGTRGILSYSFLFQLHKKMFCDVWTWAGTKRQRDTNLGSDPSRIDEEVMCALDDAIFWHEEDVFRVDDRAIRLHHRLVTIHPFRNGNGRCTRLIADLYLISAGSSHFTWGGGSAAIRPRYIEAVRAAPADEYIALTGLSRLPVSD